MQHAKPLDRVVCHVGAEIIEQRLPIGENRSFADVGLKQTNRGRMRDLDRRGRDFAHALHPAERLGIRGEHPADPTEFAHQRLGERLGIPAGNGDREQVFDQFVIEQRVAAAFEQAFAQPAAMAFQIVPQDCGVVVCIGHIVRLAHPRAIA